MAQKPPGPKGDFLLGSLRPFSQDPPGFLVQVAQEYGPIVHLRLGPFQAYLLSQPEYIREVLVTQAAKFNKDRLDKRILSKFLGNGLLISDGDFHRRQRALAQPAFHTGRIQAYGRVMVAYTETMLAEWHAGQARPIDQDMMRLTMYIVAKTLFDADVSDRAEEAGRAIEVLQAAANLEYRRAFSTPMWLPTANNRKFSQASKSLDRIIEAIIAERRATAQNGQVEDTGDLLSMLLLARYEDGSAMNDEQVRDEAVTLFAAGHETTSNALTWTWYYLAQNPEVEARLWAELDEVLAGRAPTVDDLGRLAYSQMVIKESMRLRPPAWILNGRQAMEESNDWSLHHPGRQHGLHRPLRDAPPGRLFPRPGDIRSRKIPAGEGKADAPLCLYTLWRRPAYLHRQRLRHDGSPTDPGYGGPALSPVFGW